MAKLLCFNMTAEGPVLHWIYVLDHAVSSCFLGLCRGGMGPVTPARVAAADPAQPVTSRRKSSFRHGTPAEEEAHIERKVCPALARQIMH